VDWGNHERHESRFSDPPPLKLWRAALADATVGKQIDRMLFSVFFAFFAVKSLICAFLSVLRKLLMKRSNLPSSSWRLLARPKSIRLSV
jgi:hypothetical protein